MRSLSTRSPAWTCASHRPCRSARTGCRRCVRGWQNEKACSLAPSRAWTIRHPFLTDLDKQTDIDTRRVRRCRCRPSRRAPHHLVPCSPSSRRRSPSVQPPRMKKPGTQQAVVDRPECAHSATSDGDFRQPTAHRWSRGRRQTVTTPAPNAARSSPTRPLPRSTQNVSGRRMTGPSPRWMNTGDSPGCSASRRCSRLTVSSLKRRRQLEAQRGGAVGDVRQAP